MIQRQAYWIKNLSSNIPQFKPLTGVSHSVDVAIIGSGISGLSCALSLHKKGMKVAVIEASKIAQGVSLHSTGKISSIHRLCYATLKEKYGLNEAKTYAAMNENAIDTITKVVKELNIDCSLKIAPHIVYTVDEQDVKKIKQEYDVCKELGFKCSYEESLPELPYEVKAALKVENQAYFNSYAYLLGIAKYLDSQKVAIYEDSRVQDISFTSPHTVSTDNGSISAKHVVVATHLPILDRSGHFASNEAKRSYGIAVTLTDDKKIPTSMYISANNGGTGNRSLRPTADGKVLIVGGNGHDVGVKPSEGDEQFQYEDLVQFAKKNFPVKEVLCRWSSHDYIPNDFLPYIGYMHYGTNTLYTATGFKKWGFTQGTAAGDIITELITKGSESLESNEFAKLCDARRWDVSKSITSAVKLQAFLGKHFFKEHVKQTVITKDIEDLANGEGAVCSYKGKSCGAYKDENGKVHLVNTTCTHLGFKCTFNTGDKTWDCCAHGSRFDVDGNILHGPATKPLKKYEHNQ